MNDETLIELIRAGNGKAFEWITTVAYESCKNHILRNSGSEQEAEEVFNDALLRLYRQVSNNEHFTLTTHIKNYMYAIVKRAWYEVLRKKKSKKKKGEWEVNVEDPQKLRASESLTVEIFEEEEMSPKYQKALDAFDQLSEDCQSVLKARYVEDITLKAHAENLNYSQDYVKVKRHRCMGNWKKLFRKAIGGD